jgi:hypothetical protein
MIHKTKLPQTRRNTISASIFAAAVAGVAWTAGAPSIACLVVWLVVFLPAKLMLDVGVAVEKTVRRAANRDD